MLRLAAVVARVACGSRFAVALGPLVALSLACNDTRTRSYSIDIKNDSTRPITVGFVKLGPPMERAWMSPEDLAERYPYDMTLSWGTVVPPNRTAFIQDYKGEFLPTTSAELRIYVGQMSLSDLLAISRASRSRQDVRLEEGKSVYIVSDRGPYIDAVRTNYVPMGEAAKAQGNVRVGP